MGTCLIYHQVYVKQLTASCIRTRWMANLGMGIIQLDGRVGR